MLARLVWIPLVLFAVGVPVHADASPPCSDVPGVGLACERADGLLDVFAPDGTYLGPTHGPDDVDPSTAAAPAPRQPPCATLGGDSSANVGDSRENVAVQVILAAARDDPTKTDGADDLVRDLVAQANALLYEASMRSGGVGTDVRVDCIFDNAQDRWEVNVIPRVYLDTPLAETTFATVVSELRSLGHNLPYQKYWIWFDDSSPCSCAGMGTLIPDDRGSVANLNNGLFTEPTYAIVWGHRSARTMLHEISHNMGAVQASAPHSTGAGHCTDGLDTMCYRDDGPNGGQYTTAACSSEVYDCGNDDYCNSRPAVGTYLATHWNVCSSNNLFVRMSDDPTNTAGFM